MSVAARDGTSAHGERWAIASPHPAASDAAADAFAAGGTAVDAALHAAVMLAVVAPHQCGVGGDLFALVQNPDGKLVAIDASGRAPAAADAAALRARHGTAMPSSGPDTITVPGAVRGWEAVHRQGAVLPWADAFAGAIRGAADGTPISHDLAGSIAASVEDLRRDQGFAEVVYRDGVPPAGTPLVQPALARTLEALAAEGPAALYDGETGRTLVDGLRAAGAALSLDDLAAHTVDLVPPLRGRYRDVDVSVTPPASQGFVLLEALAVVQRLEIDPDPLGSDAVLVAAALRAAAADRDRHLADPDAMTVHVSALLDDGHLAAVCDGVRSGAPAHGSVPARAPSRGGDTIALVTADAEGWGVALIQSVYSGFGSGILEPGTGIVLHDRGACFTLEPGHPNEIAPGKRPAHTLMPVAVHRDGDLAALVGTRGGHAQPQIDLMTLVRAFDLGMEPSAAVAAPRWLVGGMEPLDADPWVAAEALVPRAVREAFARDRYRIELLADVDRAVGHAQMLARRDGGFWVGSDPRSDAGARAG